MQTATLHTHTQSLLTGPAEVPDVISRDKAAEEHKGALSLSYEGKEGGQTENRGGVEFRAGQWFRDRDGVKRIRGDKTKPWRKERENVKTMNEGGEKMPSHRNKRRGDAGKENRRG